MASKNAPTVPRRRYADFCNKIGAKQTNGVGPLMSVVRVPAQPVDATQALNLSAGVSNCKVSRGRSFS
jgi:hypothetical protein